MFDKLRRRRQDKKRIRAVVERRRMEADIAMVEGLAVCKECHGIDGKHYLSCSKMQTSAS